jgi:hypothetical protein
LKKGTGDRGQGTVRRSLALLFLVCGALYADNYYVTIAGLGGEQEYEQRFTGWAKDLDKVLKTAESDAHIVTLMGPEATRAKVESTLREIAKTAKADDALVVMLIGHGSFDEADYKFNLPGPDISATELASLLDKIAAKQLVVNMTSCSGGSLIALEKPKRVVITATKSGTERNATVFARYWIEALRDPAADADKNEVVTALEAFRYAEGKTSNFYESQKRLATEHPMLEDTGKGEGVKNPGAENGQGLIATRFPLIRLGKNTAALNDPAKLQLLKRKEALEQAIDELKYKKASMDLREYRQALAQYVTELAQVQQELDK